ncbi:hypothetical protein T492DRAFT_954055 [Pavlovales sp. CCMP2436]|nr:hypothetical protein T492DRAFT_954055 [Pavlovales sp. CCMP2436]
MVTARRAPVVRISSAISARLRVVIIARGHSAPAPRHLSERRTLIGGRAGQARDAHPSCEPSPLSAQVPESSRARATTPPRPVQPSRASAGRKTPTRVADDRLGR